MESNGDSRGGFLSAGGIISIVAGVSQIIGGLLLVAPMLLPEWFMYSERLVLGAMVIPLLRDFLWVYVTYAYGLFEAVGLVAVAAGVGVLSILAIIGGISAIRRKWFGLSLAGAICALLAGILGILAGVFVVLGKREFKAKEMGAEVV